MGWRNEMRIHNLQTLLLFQEAAREDLADACLYWGVARHVAKRVARATLPELIEWSNVGQSLVTVRPPFADAIAARQRDRISPAATLLRALTECDQSAEECEPEPEPEPEPATAECGAIEDEDFQELNLVYLLKVRAAARKDIATAALRFGVPKSLLERLVQANLTSLRCWAAAPMVMVTMRPAFGDVLLCHTLSTAHTCALLRGACEPLHRETVR